MSLKLDEMLTDEEVDQILEAVLEQSDLPVSPSIVLRFADAAENRTDELSQYKHKLFEVLTARESVHPLFDLIRIEGVWEESPGALTREGEEEEPSLVDEPAFVLDAEEAVDFITALRSLAEMTTTNDSLVEESSELHATLAGHLFTVAEDYFGPDADSRQSLIVCRKAVDRVLSGPVLGRWAGASVDDSAVSDAVRTLKGLWMGAVLLQSSDDGSPAVLDVEAEIKPLTENLEERMREILAQLENQIAAGMKRKSNGRLKQELHFKNTLRNYVSVLIKNYVRYVSDANSLLERFRERTSELEPQLLSEDAEISDDLLNGLAGATDIHTRLHAYLTLLTSVSSLFQKMDAIEGTTSSYLMSSSDGDDYEEASDAAPGSPEHAAVEESSPAAATRDTSPHPPPAAEQDADEPDDSLNPLPYYPRAGVPLPLPVAFKGFCPYSIVESDGLLMEGNPESHCARYRGHLFAFHSSEGLEAFLRDPLFYVRGVYRTAEAASELIYILDLESWTGILEGHELQNQLRSVMEKQMRDMDGDDRMPIPSLNMKSVSTETPTHFVEKHIDYSYHWNEWELRRLALQRTNLKSKSTHSAQTYVSCFRREQSTQVYLPKEQETQTMRETGTNTIRRVTYMKGLRGEPDAEKALLTLTIDS